MTPTSPVLISVAELRARSPSERALSLSKGVPAAPITLVDVRWTLAEPDGRPAYEAGHIPGAVYVDLESELSGPHVPSRTGRHPLPDPQDFEATMRRIGVRADRPVVVYDAATSLAAARLWWLLTDAGHEQVRVLDGGLAAWQAAGLPVAAGREPEPESGDVVARPGHRRRVEAAELGARARRSGLVDVRAAERYRGEVEPIDPVAGHIPGAVNLPSTTLLGADARYLPSGELRQRLAAVGPDPVFYCGSGITAAHALLGYEAAGLTGGAIYPGSWSEWITDPARPVATGP